jgi:apolipoprotein D and lipocalin family protein
MTKKQFITLAAVALLNTSCSTPSSSSPNSIQSMRPLVSISSLELNRYLGTWYEIAKYPNRFQAMCKSNTTAQYSLLPEGGINVLNSCTDDKGLTTQANGAARIKIQPSQLEVSFAPNWTRWLPIVWANYWVVALDANYGWVLISEPNRQYAWVLAREKKLNDADWTQIKAAIAAAELDLKKLEMTIQN